MHKADPNLLPTNEATRCTRLSELRTEREAAAPTADNSDPASCCTARANDGVLSARNLGAKGRCDV